MAVRVRTGILYSRRSRREGAGSPRLVRLETLINTPPPSFTRPKMETKRDDYQKYHRLQRKLEKEIEKSNTGLQEMPDEVWDDEERRREWIAQDRAQWNHNNQRADRLQRLYDRCFPKKGWVITEIERFFEAEEGPVY